MFGRFKFILIPLVYAALNNLNHQLYPLYHHGQKGHFMDPAMLFCLSAVLVFTAGFIFRRIIFPLLKKMFMIQFGIFMTFMALKAMKFELNKTSIGLIVFSWIIVGIYFSVRNTRVSGFFSKVTGISSLWKKIKNIFKSKNQHCSIDLSLSQIDQLGGGNINQKGRLFEEYVAEVYRTLGYNAQTTTSLREQGRLPEGIQKRGGSGEQGVDVIVEYVDQKTKTRAFMAIQCKHYSNKVGNSAVQEINAALPLYKASMGIVITNHYFTKQAQELAAANGILLIDRDGLGKLVESAVNNFEQRQTAA